METLALSLHGIGLALEPREARVGVAGIEGIRATQTVLQEEPLSSVHRRRGALSLIVPSVR